MEKLIKKPSEEIYEIEFSGQFIPEKLSPLWFANKKLLGKKEARQAKIVNIYEGSHCSFKTEFLEIYIQPHRFRILSKNLNSYDLVNDMGISIAKILEDSLYDDFYLNLKLHYTFPSDETLAKMLNKLHNTNQWNEIFDSNQLHAIQLFNFNETETYMQKTLLSISPCDRTDMQHTTHLFIKNHFHRNPENSSIVSILESNEHRIDSSIILANKIIKKYF